MKITLVQIGKTSEKYIMTGIEEYSSRIVKYAPFEIITVQDIRNTRNMPSEEQKMREGEKILKLAGSDDYVILLDENGKVFNTIEFAEQLKKLFMLSKKRIVFVIGGPYGFSSEVYKRSDMLLSLSPLTFSHQLVRLLFSEQLYRVLSVIKGDPYHHE